jgi:hypothetical protein
VARFGKVARLIRLLFQINTVPVAWSVRGGFPLLDRFDRWTLRTIESGLVSKWVDDAYNDKYFVPYQKVEGFVPLDFDHVFSIFALWIFALSVSCSCFVAEIICGNPRFRFIK